MVACTATGLLLLTVLATSVNCQDILTLEFEIWIKPTSPVSVNGTTTAAPATTDMGTTTVARDSTSEDSIDTTYPSEVSTLSQTDDVSTVIQTTDVSTVTQTTDVSIVTQTTDVSTVTQTTDVAPVTQTESSVTSETVGGLVIRGKYSYQGDGSINVKADLKDFLDGEYKNTTAYLEIGNITETTRSSRSSSDKYIYQVMYNLGDLASEECSESTGGCQWSNCYERLACEVEQVQQDIACDGGNITDGFEVDTNKTVPEGTDDIESQIKSELAAITCTCEKTEICYQSEYSIPECRDICDVYMEDNTGCADDYFLVEGAECRLEDDGKEEYTPYCYCGRSLLLDNIYLYDTCQNMSFIVGMSSGILALILLILFIAIGCLASSNNSHKKEVNDLKKTIKNDAEAEAYDLEVMANPTYGVKTSQNPAAVKHDKYAAAIATEDIKFEPSGSKGRKQNHYSTPYDLPPSQRDDNSRKQNNLGQQNGHAYQNQGYGPEPGAPWDSSSAEISESEAYRNFNPSISHIDPRRDYNIKRPNITVRPMDNLYNMENDKDFPMQSFHI